VLGLSVFTKFAINGKEETPQSEAMQYVRFEAKAGKAFAIATNSNSLICLHWRMEGDEHIAKPIHLHYSKMELLEGEGAYISGGDNNYINRKSTAICAINDDPTEFPNWRYIIAECSKSPTDQSTLNLSLTDKWMRFLRVHGTSNNVKMWVRRGTFMAPLRFDGLSALADGTQALFIQMPVLESSEYVLPTF
jgi:hypothetical protein